MPKLYAKHVLHTQNRITSTFYQHDYRHSFLHVGFQLLEYLPLDPHQPLDPAG